MENDVNCAGLAECLAGAAKGCASAVCLTIGTGIGGAILFHDRVYHGFSGSACEVGYMNIPGGMFQDLGSAGALLSSCLLYTSVPMCIGISESYNCSFHSDLFS